METKIKTANIRIALSHSYSTFEVAFSLENESGISIQDIDEARKQCQELATSSVNEYKTLPNANVKAELQKVENKMSELKKMVAAKEPEKVDPAAVAEIEKLPLYQPKVVGKVGKAKTEKK